MTTEAFKRAYEATKRLHRGVTYDSDPSIVGAQISNELTVVTSALEVILQKQSENDINEAINDALLSVQNLNELANILKGKH